MYLVFTIGIYKKEKYINVHLAAKCGEKKKMPVKEISDSDFAELWAKNLKASTETIRKGVERVKESPTEKAAASKEKMKAKIVEAIDSGRWERGLKKVTLDQWKKAFSEKGISRISAGADNSKPKVQDFAKALLDYQKSNIATVDKMPTTTIDDAIAKMDAWVRTMAKFKYK